MTVAIPVHMKGLFRMEPFVILASADSTALIHVDRKRYESIVAPHRQGTYLERLSGTMAAFAEYANTLSRTPVNDLMSEYPGSLILPISQVRSFRLYIDNEASKEGTGSHYAFEIVASGRRYRGTVDRGAGVSGKNAALKEIFGERFV